jgi:predicted Zn-ribbon and HTH transcriptional regulator
MGAKYEATCRDCSHAFQASKGGGFHFFELHCFACGQTKNVRHDLIPEATDMYHRATREAVEATGRSLDNLLAVAGVTDDDALQRLRGAIVEAANRFDQVIEPIVGRCRCGGQFGLNASVRCPACKSTNVREGQTLLQYI